MRIVEVDELRSVIDLDDLRHAVKGALIAAACGRAARPGVLHLDMGADGGDLHVKAGWLTGAELFTVKLAGAFPGAVACGLPAHQGLSLVCDAVTGAPTMLLLDGGWLTEVRTAAAVAASLDHLAPVGLTTVAVLGAGSQAGHQVDALTRVRRPDRVLIWARRHSAAVGLAQRLRAQHDLEITAVSEVRGAVEGAEVVITTTSAREAILFERDLRQTVLVLAVGADTAGKQELEARLVRSAARLVVDDLEQCATQGELQHAVEVAESAEVLGTQLAAPRRLSTGRTVVDFTGVGVQDAAAAQLAVRALRKASAHARPAAAETAT